VGRGDRVIVINEDNEYIDCTGVFVGLTSDGRLVIELDYTTWLVPFDPHELESL
jgi:hypothetical protein